MLALLATAVVVLAGGVAALLFVILAYGFTRIRAQAVGPADAVVVLGSTLRPDGTVPPLLARRLDRAVRTVGGLRRADSGPVLIVSGGKGRKNPVTEASVMAEYVLARGFVGELVQEDVSHSTVENIQRTAQIVSKLRPDHSRCIVVTSGPHCLRTALLCGRTGLRADVLGAAVPFRRSLSMACRELAALVIGYWKTAVLVYLVVCLAVALL